MRVIEDHDELVAVCGGDTLCRWAAQGGRARAWARDGGRGLAVAAAGLSRRDRIAVHGAADAVVPLVRDVLHVVGPTYRPLGDPELIAALVDRVPGLVAGKAFGWMETTTAPRLPETTGAQWLAAGDLDEATALLESVFPDSNAMPGVPGVECWAGIRDETGRLVATAALAWSAPAVGLLAGVGVHPDARGRGLGRAICAFVLGAALRRHGAAALMVDEWNHSAIRLYESLGMRYRPLLAAYVV